MAYRHRIKSKNLELPLGKVVCVGRNYAEHAKELNNPVPSSPILFIKPATAVVELELPLSIPQGRGECHHELELALLIGQELSRASVDQALAAVVGYGLGLDLTLRELQSELKAKGHPWERAKAFDGACPLSSFIPAEQIGDWRELSLRLERNHRVQQQGSCRDMLFPVEQLLAEISHSFTLLPGDVVLTGTPAGVGPIEPGDQLLAQLYSNADQLLSISTGIDS